MSKKRLFIIDAMAMAFRSYHAIRPLTSSQGVPVNAVYGSLLFLWSLIERQKPDYLAFATDSQEKTFRHTLYGAYKANRSEMPADLAAQLPYLFRLFEALEAPMLKEGGLEADDLIGSLVVQEASPDLHCYIVSGDKDFMQLINENVTLFSPKKGGEVLEINEPEVFTKFGCHPKQVIDVLALIGDSSDNVPGVPGIGDKGAAKLIQQYGSLDAIYEHLAEIGNQKQRLSLESNRELAYLSQKLVTIHTTAQLHFQLEQLRCDPNTALGNTRLLSLLEELEFKSYVERVRARIKSLPSSSVKARSTTSNQKRSYHTVQSEKDVSALVERARAAPHFAFDTETTGLDRISDTPVGVSLSFAAGEAYYMPLHESHRHLEMPRLLQAIEQIVASPALKIGHNIKFDLQMLRNIDIDVAGPFADTMIMSYLLDSGERLHNLDEVCLRYLHEVKIKTSELLDAKGSILGAPLEKLSEYACEDADYTLRLYDLLQPKLAKAELLPVFEEIEMPLVPILARMEQTGIHVDSDILQEISDRLSKRAQELELSIYQLAGETFNINSTKQLATILFEKLKVHEALGVKRIKKTKTGYSTDVSVLEQMSEHPLPFALLEYRMLSKLKNTYVDTLPQLIHQKTQRIHTNFHQTGTATGRLSSSDPNLQNIPIRSPMGKEIRKAFCSNLPGWVTISADYSQIELRVLASLANDAQLKEAFIQGHDIHTSTAAKIFGLEESQVSSEQRSQAKAINFGIIYGMGPQRLARETGVTMKEAKDFIDRYFASYPRIRTYIENSIQFARDHEYTRTITGRRRPLKEINGSRDGASLANAQNVAVNSPVQGSAADLIKKAMVEVQKKLDESDYHAKMLLQVHDELVFECPAGEVEAVMQLIRREMEHAYDLGVPLKVDISFGKNWLEAH